MPAVQSQSAAGALALLSAAGDPERTKAAIARMDEKEDNAREAARAARAEITALQQTRKELDVHAKALEAAQAKSEQDLVARRQAQAKSEESIARRETGLKDDLAVLRSEQTTHKQTSRLEMDRLKNLEISLSGREKALKQEQTKIQEQALNLKEAIATANAVKDDYEARVVKLTAALAG